MGTVRLYGIVALSPRVPFPRTVSNIPYMVLFVPKNGFEQNHQWFLVTNDGVQNPLIESEAINRYRMQ
jgi:hypothetical protein